MILTTRYQLLRARFKLWQYPTSRLMIRWHAFITQTNYLLRIDGTWKSSKLRPMSGK